MPHKGAGGYFICTQDLWKSLGKFAERSEADHLGLKRCHPKWFEHMCEAGLTEVKAALEGWLQSSVAALTASAAKLSTEVVPDWEEFTPSARRFCNASSQQKKRTKTKNKRWEEFVVAEFDVEHIKGKILSADWSSFATRWQSINVSHSLVDDLTSPECGSFKSVTGTPSVQLSKNIGDLKAWIVVVSLCSFIVEELAPVCPGGGAQDEHRVL